MLSRTSAAHLRSLPSQAAQFARFLRCIAGNRIARRTVTRPNLNHIGGNMIDDIDRTDAIFLVAQHGRNAVQVAAAQTAGALGRGDRGEARRWLAIRSFLQQAMA